MAEEIVNAILSARYFHVGETRWEDVSRRVSIFVGTNDVEREAFYDLLNEHKFLPNSPTLMNAGRKNGQLNACFVLPVEDSMEDIFDAIKNTAMIHKTGGGTGFCFSKLRGKNARVKSTNGCASGVVSFMRVFDEATEAVKQGGTRRGANMGVLHVDHPDILDFIKCKSEEGKISNFNLSLMLTKEFIDHVENCEWDAVIAQSFNTDETRNNITVKDVWDGLIYGMWKNGEPSCLFDDNINDQNMLKNLGRIIATNPCVVGETLITTDKGNIPIANLVGKTTTIWNGFEWSVVVPFITSGYEKLYCVKFSNGSEVLCTSYHKWHVWVNDFINEIVTTNQLTTNDALVSFCTPDGVCYSCIHVLSVEKYDENEGYPVYCLNEPKNHTFIANGVITGNCGEQLLFDNESCNLGSMNISKYVTDGKFDWDTFETDVKRAYHFLNNVVDKNVYPIPEITEMSHKTRRVGLGVMGYHDALLKQRICYDSAEALVFLEQVLLEMKTVCIGESRKLAIEHGVFDAWKGSEWDKQGIPMRNGALLSIAPTGSISLLANCSSSIEPVFNWVYQRHNTIGKSFLMVHPLFEADLKNMCKTNTALYDKIINQVFKDGTLQNVKEIPDKVKDLYKCALDISPIWHLRTLSMAQTVVDASISKTINLAENTTKEDIENIVLLAHKMGCKGVTVYRTNSRKEVVMSAAQTNDSGFVEVIKDGEIYVKCPDCGYLTKGHGGCNTCIECGYTKCS